MHHHSKHTAPTRAWLRGALLAAALATSAACGGGRTDGGGGGAGDGAATAAGSSTATPAAPVTPTPAATAPDTVGTMLAGTNIELRITQMTCAGSAHIGDPVAATVNGAVLGVSGAVIPAGSPVSGRVTLSAGSDAMLRVGRLELAFDSVDVNGRRYPFAATVIGATPLVRLRGYAHAVRYCVPSGGRVTVTLTQDIPIRLQ